VFLTIYYRATFHGPALRDVIIWPTSNLHTPSIL